MPDKTSKVSTSTPRCTSSVPGAATNTKTGEACLTASLLRKYKIAEKGDEVCLT
jgi:hypothetical protein